MEDRKAAGFDEYVRSYLILADRMRDIVEEAALDKSSDRFIRAKTLLEKIENSIALVRSDVEGIRLANTRPRTERTAAFVSQTKDRISDRYKKLETEVTGFGQTEAIPEETTPGADFINIPEEKANENELLQEVTNLMRVANGGTQNATKKREFSALLDLLTKKELSCEVLVLIRDRIKANPAIPPGSIEEIRNLIYGN